MVIFLENETYALPSIINCQPAPSGDFDARLKLTLTSEMFSLPCFGGCVIKT